MLTHSDIRRFSKPANVRPDGQRRKAPETFDTKSDAQDWLNLTRADIERHHWRGPDASAINSETYARRWVDERGQGGGRRTPHRHHRAEVFDRDDTMGTRWRLMALLGAFAPLRPEELAELRRHSVDLDECSLRITLASLELTNGRRATGDPKTRAGKRTVHRHMDSCSSSFHPLQIPTPRRRTRPR